MPDQRYWHAGQPTDTSCVGPTPTEARKTSCLYLHGGSTRMPAEAAVRATDWRPAAGLSDGTPGQEFYARWAPVSDATVAVDGVPWSDYTVDGPTGRITFNGTIPPAGAAVTVAYTSGPHPGFADYYAQLKAAFPQLRICSNVDLDEAIELFADRQPYDCLVKHAYVSDQQIPDYTTVDDHLGQVLDRMRVPIARTAALRAAIDRWAGPRARDIHLMVTEYGYSGAGPVRGEAPGLHLGLGGGLVEAAFLTELIKLGVPVAQKHALTDYVYRPQPPGTIDLSSQNSLIAGPGPDTVITPQGRALGLLRPLADGRLTPTAVLGNPTTELSNGVQAPALRTVAAQHPGGRIELVVLNQDARPVTARVGPAGRIPIVVARELSAPDLVTANTPAAPDRVRIERDAGFSPNWTFPPHSVTRLTLFAPRVANRT